MAGIVVIFDFDETIIDCKGDTWIVDQFGATQLFNQLLLTMPWKSAMDRMMREFHSQGKTIQDIANCLNRAPLHPPTISPIKSAYALGCELRIVSDANHFYIETILKHHGIFDYFSDINTNPSFVNEDGKLRIFPFHDFTTYPHGCNLCLPNMRKGMVMERIQESLLVDGKKRIIYLGDGKEDFCPSLRLGEGDFLMPKKNFPLSDLISINPLLVKAEIHEWSDAEEQERVVIQLINKITREEKSAPQMYLMDCKLETVPISSHGVLIDSVINQSHSTFPHSNY